ncbi:MAG: 4-hydroxythreonine-4-phosphate dehydrogenase PdxA [Pontiellaceae bacterium]|jgi:4-hydroxythreonine-4-phosphate dehydrogenase|nr:4-hydroxythreonine-4-phosphate dehydrogenase PdxA [Pontiellaceae bacterium]
MKPVRIGITCGDINGIGPEIVLKAVSSGRWESNVEFIRIGPSRIFGASNGWNIPFNEEVTPGKITAEASRTAVDAIKRAVRGCLEGELDAMVTAPICKEGLKLAGINYPGHTELIADLTGTTRYGMVLMGKDLRVMLATRHLPLRAVADALTKENVLEAIELTGETLSWFGLQNRRIGVCGLNPHAGDGGTLGSEEATIIAPAIEAARAKGFNAIGPVPADVIFYQALQKQYDAVVAMYHDQGLGPLKMHAFDCGINLTPGLPIVRTSPDHGTAFGIAGQGIAKADSMIAAIETAIQLAGRTSPWGNLTANNANERELTERLY